MVRSKHEFQLQSSSIREITEGNEWNSETVRSIEETELAEILNNDQQPFFVEFVALYEGLSRNNNLYTRESVQSCVDAMIGVNMYKGHIQPGTSDWAYREPVGKVVSAKLSEINIDGKRVLAAKGKAYITSEDPKLRADIRRKMAGPVSVLGNSISARDLTTGKCTILEIKKPLKSIDFCNPGTGGLVGAGVTDVVAEIACKDLEEEEKMKLTKEELLADYGKEISEIVKDKISDELDSVAKQQKELAEMKSKNEAIVVEKDLKIQEMATEVANLTKEIDELKKTIEADKNKLLMNELTLSVNTAIAEMKKADAKNALIIDTVFSDINIELIDNDVKKSTDAIKAKVTSGVEKISKIVSEIAIDPATRNHTGNPSNPNNPADKLSKILSPELFKSINGDS